MDETIWKRLTCGEKFLEFEAVRKHHRKSAHQTYGNQYKNKRRTNKLYTAIRWYGAAHV